ncbi:dienelactone hydrolase family protein [bacterium]|nr:dienelactone hydrolase family protein [bacterium]
MDSKYIELYDEYNEGIINRREFLKRLAIMAGGVLAASSLLPLLENNYAKAEIVSKNDPSIISEYVTYPTASGNMRANLVWPSFGASFPAVVVIHENRGLNPHIEDVTRRMALEGFLALAPDALSPLGGTPVDPDKARDMIGTLDASSNLDNFLAAVKFLKYHPVSNGKVGCMGFCWGGGLANQLAVHSDELTAAVPYYGIQPKTEDVPRIKASLLLHYGEEDERINKGIDAYEAALQKAGVDYKLYIYPGAGHAFNNDTNPSRYNRGAAELAWKRTRAFLYVKLSM